MSLNPGRQSRIGMDWAVTGAFAQAHNSWRPAAKKPNFSAITRDFNVKGLFRLCQSGERHASCFLCDQSQRATASQRGSSFGYTLFEEGLRS